MAMVSSNHDKYWYGLQLKLYIYEAKTEPCTADSYTKQNVVASELALLLP